MDNLFRQKGRGRQPLVPDLRDNEWTALLKQILRTVIVREGRLLNYEDDGYAYNPGVGDLPPSTDLGVSVNIIEQSALNFLDPDDPDAITPEKPSYPTAQTSLYSLGFGFMSPVSNFEGVGQDRFTTPFGSTANIEPMGGGEVFRVQSNGDLNRLYDNRKIFHPQSGTTSVWCQGYDNIIGVSLRHHYILDIGGKFLVYYDHDHTAAGIYRLKFFPNSDNTTAYKYLDLDPSAVNPDWFGYGLNKLVVSWDYATQEFELFFGGRRAQWHEDYDEAYIPMPSTYGSALSLGNSLEETSFDSGTGGQEHAQQQFHDWKFDKYIPGLTAVTAVDGGLSRSLIPIHEGVFSGVTCSTPTMTPIDIGSSTAPFDTAYVKSLRVYCDAVISGAIVGGISVQPITILNPTSSEDVSMFFTDDAILVGQIVVILTGSASPSVTWTLRYDPDRSAAGTEVVTGGTVTTSVTTGSVVTVFDSPGIIANNFVWLETTAKSGTVTSLNVSVRYSNAAGP